MDYGMIGQIAKAKHYAQERHRIKFTNFVAHFTGNNNDHTVEYTDGAWKCTASFFQSHGWSSHTIAIERILEQMINPLATAEHGEPIANSAMISQLEKAKQYTDEPHRVRFISFHAIFAGENHDHTVRYENGKWTCTCNFFKSHAWCSHSVALERILKEMVAPVTSEPMH